MAEFKPAPTTTEGTSAPRPAPVDTKDRGTHDGPAPEKREPQKHSEEQPTPSLPKDADTRDPEEVLRELASVEFSVAAAKHRIGKEGQTEQEVVEQEARMTARARMTEGKEKWAGKAEGEDSTKIDQLKQSFKQAIPRWWKYGVHSLNTYVKEKDQSHQLLAEAGVQMKSLPYEFLRNIRNAAQETITAARDQEKADRDARRDGMNRREKMKDRVASARDKINENQTDDMSRWERGKNKIKNLRELAGRNQRELAAQEVEIVRTLRSAYDARSSGEPGVQAFVAANPELVQSYKDVLTGDFKAGEGLARRLGTEFSDDAIRTAVGEKRAQEIVMTGPVADFFKNEVITPMLTEGLANGGTLSEDRLLEIRTAVQEKFFSKEFTNWRNNLPEDVRSNLDLSMSYGTNIVPMVENVLLPQLMSIKNHLQSEGNLQNYVDQMVLKVNVGTLQAGEQGSVQETKREAKYARSVTNQRVMDLYQKIEQDRGPEFPVPGAYLDAIDSASGRLKALGFVGGHNTAGFATGLGLYALQRAGALGGNIFLPILGGSAVAGAVRAGQERSRFTREYEQHGREAARGVAFDKEAKRRNEMKKLELPMLDIKTGVLDPLEQARKQLQSGRVTNDILNNAFGLLADSKVRRQMMDDNTNVELYRTTTDQSLDAQKTDLELLKARTTAELRKYAQDNVPGMQAYARSLGVDFQPGDSVDKILNPLSDALQRNIQRGTEVQNQFQAALSTSIESNESIDSRDSAMRRARVLAQAKQGSMTFVMAAGGSVIGHAVTQEIFAGLHRGAESIGLADRPTQMTSLERFFGAGEVGPATEGFTSTTSHAADIMGHRVNVPDGTHWVEDNGRFDLVLDAKPDQVLINDAFFQGDTLQYDQGSSLVNTENIATRFETRTIERPVSGETGVWNEWATKTNHREYYGYDTRPSERNELRFHTLRQGDAVVLQIQNMEFSQASGLNPSKLDVQQAIQRGEAQVALSLPGELNNSIIIKANDVFQRDGVWMAGLSLDPNSSEMITLGDGQQIEQRELFNLLINRDVYNTLPQGDFASEVRPQERDLFNLGGPDGTGRGQISAGRLIDTKGGEKAWQSFATIFGTGTTPPNVDLYENVTVTDITANIEGTEDPWDPIGIPTPFPWPRRPLEAGNDSTAEPTKRYPDIYPTGYYGYYGAESGAEGLGLLKREDYAKRRSETLKNNPEAELDEREEVSKYIDSWSPEYRAELEAMDTVIGRPMSEHTRAVVTVPAYEEGRNIKKALEQYLNQKQKNGQPLSPDAFEIVIVDNHPERVAKDNTEDEIRVFLLEHPEMRVSYVHKPWKEGDTAGVGNARKYATDIALLRSQKRAQSDGELLLIAGDADVEAVSDRYIDDYVQRFDGNKNIDAASGRWDLPEDALANPNLRAAERFWYILDRVIAHDAAGDPEVRQRRAAGLIGRNSAVRASTFAAVGGYNPEATLAEDLELGWLISDARHGNPDRFSYVASSQIVSNPRRFLSAMSQGVPLLQMYGGFHENTEVRKLDEQQLLAQIPKDFDPSRLQHELDAFWQAGSEGQYQYLGDRFPDLFQRASGFLGVDYVIENGHVRLTNVSRLVDGLSRFQQREDSAPAPIPPIQPGAQTNPGDNPPQPDNNETPETTIPAPVDERPLPQNVEQAVRITGRMAEARVDGGTAAQRMEEARELLRREPTDAEATRVRNGDRGWGEELAMTAQFEARPDRTPRREQERTPRFPTIAELGDTTTRGITYGTEQTGTAEVHELAISAQEREAVMNRVRINAHPFRLRGLSDQETGATRYVERNLEPDDLDAAGLGPQYKLEIDGKSILFSDPYQVSRGRTAYVAYVPNERNDRYVARTFYLSNSQGVWRYLPSYLSDGADGVDWYDKGMSEQSINAPIAMQEALNSILVSRATPPIVPPGNPNFYFAGTAREIGKIAEERANITYRVEVDATPVSLPGTFEASAQERRANGAKLAPENIQFSDPQAAPDFSEGPIETWQQQTSLYGNITMEIYESQDKNYRYMLCRDVKDRVWVGGIEDKSAVTSVGVRKSWIQGGDLMTPAYEYTSQVGRQEYANQRDRNGNYVDMYANYISKIPMIRDYNAVRAARDQASPENDGSTPQPEEPGADRGRAIELTSSENLLNDLNNRLESVAGPGQREQIFEVQPTVMAEFLQNNNGLFPRGTEIRELGMNVVNSSLQINGEFILNRAGVTVPVHLENATFRVNSQGAIELVGDAQYTIDVPGLLRGTANSQAERILRDIDNRLKAALTNQTPGWGVRRFSLNGGKIGVQFSNNQNLAEGIDTAYGPED